MKVAGHELKSLEQLMGMQVEGLYFPLLCIVDYKGYRLVAESTIPGKESSFSSFPLVFKNESEQLNTDTSIYIYIYTHTHIYIYIYIHAYISRKLNSEVIGVCLFTLTLLIILFPSEQVHIEARQLRCWEDSHE